MNTFRIDHRLKLAADPDVIHSGLVALLACLFSAGLVYLVYLARVVRTAARAPTVPATGDCLLLFGKHAPGGNMDADFAARVARVATLWHARPRRRIVLLGGAAPGHPSEARTAYAALLAAGLPADAPVLFEEASRDTLQNLRHARDLLAAEGERGRVTLVSSRYHLARCAQFATQLGFDHEPCAAEPVLSLRPGMWLRLLGEAGYVCWIDLGTRWARLIGHRRMLAKVT
ncbi:MAG: YdcF family protein [Lysobacter sp.]|nr:YdcF family protein [Lysobacter sp.]